MAMRTPGFDGRVPEESGAVQSIAEDDPVLRSMLTAPLDDEPETAGELEAVRAWRETCRGTDAATVSAEVAERVARRA